MGTALQSMWQVFAPDFGVLCALHALILALLTVVADAGIALNAQASVYTLLIAAQPASVKAVACFCFLHDALCCGTAVPLIAADSTKVTYVHTCRLHGGQCANDVGCDADLSARAGVHG